MKSSTVTNFVREGDLSISTVPTQGGLSRCNGYKDIVPHRSSRRRRLNADNKTGSELYSLLFTGTLFAASYRILAAAITTTTISGNRRRVGSLFGPVCKSSAHVILYVQVLHRDRDWGLVGKESYRVRIITHFIKGWCFPQRIVCPTPVVT